jgi:hypothetical protein
MSELDAARAIVEDINLIINEMIGTLFDNIEEAAYRIIDLNYDEDRRLNPNT